MEKGIANLLGCISDIGAAISLPEPTFFVHQKDCVSRSCAEFILLFVYFVCFLSIVRLCVALVCRVYSPNVAPCHQCHQCHSVKGSSGVIREVEAGAIGLFEVCRSLKISDNETRKKKPFNKQIWQGEEEERGFQVCDISGQHITHNMCH